MIIKGAKCRRLKAGEIIRRGDMFKDGSAPVGWIGRAETEGTNYPLYRPIKRAKPKASGIEAMVCADIAERQKKGIAKYGTTVAENPLRDLAWIRHAYEEATDLAVYLRKIIANMEAKGK